MGSGTKITGKVLCRQWVHGLYPENRDDMASVLRPMRAQVSVARVYGLLPSLGGKGLVSIEVHTGIEDGWGEADDSDCIYLDAGLLGVPVPQIDQLDAALATAVEELERRYGMRLCTAEEWSRAHADWRREEVQRQSERNRETTYVVREGRCVVAMEPISFKARG